VSWLGAGLASGRRVVATAVVTALLAAGTAYVAVLAAAHGSGTTPTVAPRIARPVARPVAQPVEAPVAVPQPAPVNGALLLGHANSFDRLHPPASAPAAPPGPVLRPGDRGRLVRELQVRLFELAWLPETTTGVYDATTKEAVQGFQVKRHLKGTGIVDRRTWRRLKALTEKPTHDAMFNILHPGPALLAPGAEGDRVRDVQARLKQIAWIFGDVTGRYDQGTVEAVRGFQGRRGIPVTGEIDQRTLDRLHAMTVTPTHEELFNIEPPPGALDPRCRTGRVLCIDKTSRTLRWVVDGHVQLTLAARFGSTVNDTPTREGLFHVYYMNADHVSRLYGSAMPYAMFFSGGQAVHYSSDFATVGYYGASHGCVNIRDYDGIRWLFSQVRVGDTVVVYWS